MSADNNEESNTFTVVDEVKDEPELNDTGEEADNLKTDAAPKAEPDGEDKTEIEETAVIEDTDEPNDEEDDDDVEEDEEESVENNGNDVVKVQGVAGQQENSLNDKFQLETNTTEADHPYLDLIETFEYTPDQLVITPLPPSKPISETPFQLIETRASLIKLLQVLRNAKEIAIELLIDLRNYEKQIQVMSISTRDTDYLIDVLKLKNELLLLSEIFTNPKIVKVLYFRTSLDLSCLQHGLCLYIVNMFDLCRAASGLYAPHTRTFTSILKKDYGIAASSLKPPPNFYQRPLKDNVLEYCRTKSHHLIHMYHNYKNKLLEKDEQLYRKILEDCREASKILHFGQQEQELDYLEKSMQNRHKAELELLKKMFAWRTNVAKEFDKNPNEILDKVSLLRFASHLPIDISSVNFLTKSDYVRKSADEIIKVVKEISAKYKPTYSRGKIQPPPRQVNNKQDATNKPQDLKRKLPINKQQNAVANKVDKSPNTAQPNKRAKFDKKPNTFNNQARPRNQRPGKNSRIYPFNKPAFKNIQPFITIYQTPGSSNARDSRFSPPRGNLFLGQGAPNNFSYTQTRFQNSTPNYHGEYSTDDSMMGDYSSGYNRGANYDQGSTTQRGNARFQNRNNDNYNSRNHWRN